MKHPSYTFEKINIIQAVEGRVRWSEAHDLMFSAYSNTVKSSNSSIITVVRKFILKFIK